MQQTQTYRERSRAFLTQASEKGWGAAAMIVKAVADERGRNHSKHREVLIMAHALERETEDRELGIQFAISCELHGNFYENTLDSDGIAWRLQQVEQFVEKVDQYL